MLFARARIAAWVAGIILCCGAAALSAAAPDRFAISGQLRPAGPAVIGLAGVSTSFTTSTLSSARGVFQFKAIPPGAYILSVFVPGLGQQRQTIEVGPGSAPSGVFSIDVQLEQQRLQPDNTSTISLPQLAIPDKARNLYRKALGKLERRNEEAAEKDLLEAVRLAPNYAEALNHLGTLYYHQQKLTQAADCFRRAHASDPEAYEPLVNLGGVLLNLNQAADAWDYNVRAVLLRPGDALAHAQLGLTYFALKRYDLAEKSLLEALKLDPAQFSYPQLTLAEIYAAKGQWGKAADQLDDFVRRHPDHPAVERIKSKAKELHARML